MSESKSVETIMESKRPVQSPSTKGKTGPLPTTKRPGSLKKEDLMPKPRPAASPFSSSNPSFSIDSTEEEKQPKPGVRMSLQLPAGGNWSEADRVSAGTERVSSSYKEKRASEMYTPIPEELEMEGEPKSKSAGPVSLLQACRSPSCIEEDLISSGDELDVVEIPKKPAVPYFPDNRTEKRPKTVKEPEKVHFDPESPIQTPIEPKPALPKFYSEGNLDPYSVGDLDTSSVGEDISPEEEKEPIPEEFDEEKPLKFKKRTTSSHQSTALPGLEEQFAEMDLFRSSAEVGETYKMDKWMLHRGAMLKNSLYKLMEKHSSLQVIGLCGGKSECEEVIRALTDESVLRPSESNTNSLRLYYRKASPRLILHYTSRNKTLFSLKPYRQSSKDTIYFRLMLDLCAAIVICPDSATKEHWYRPEAGMQPHPFVSLSFDPEVLAYESIKITKSEVKELKEEDKKQKEEDKKELKVDLKLVFEAIRDKNAVNSKDSSAESVAPSRLKPDIKEIIKKTPVKVVEEAHPPVLLFTNDNFPYIFVQNMRKFNQDKVNKDTLETLGLFLRDIVHFALKNGEVEETDWKEFSGFGEFDKALREYNNAERVIDQLKRSINEAIRKVLNERTAEFLSEFNSGLLAVLAVPKGFLEDAKEQVLEELQSPADFYQVCTRCYPSRPVLGVKTHAKQVAQDRKQVANILKLHIAEENREFQRMCGDWLHHAFGEVHKAVMQELTIKPEFLNSYTVEFERFELDVHVNSVTCFHETFTTVFRTPGAPQATTAFVLDKDLAFALFSNPDVSIKFNPDSHGYSDLAKDDRLDPATLLVSGSNPHCFVCIKKSTKEVYYGQVLQGKYVSSGTLLQVYGREVSSIRDACFLPESRLLYVINERGNLYCLDLKQPEGLLPVPGLKEKEGKEFFQVKCSSNESVFVLVSAQRTPISRSEFKLSSSMYEVYEAKTPSQDQEGPKQPLELQFRVPSKSNGCHELPFKLISKDYNHYIVSFNRKLAEEIGENEEKGKLVRPFRIFHFALVGDYFIKEDSRATINEIDGNPIVDGFIYALKNYGYDLNKPPLPSKAFYIYVKPEEKAEGFEHYPQSTPLSHYFPSFSCINFDDLSTFQAEPVSKRDLKWTIESRQPVHVCSIQDGKLIPLNQGLLDFAKFRKEVPEKAEDYTQRFIKYTDLGSIENLLKKVQSPLVISIMGKQSSGKSYLLNRLFDTRFDVSSNRCTDGIWLSAVKSAGKILIVLDCEGLFSVERTELEEIKLCVLLSAISDVTILNQDLAMGKYLSDLLEKFERAKNRVSGNNLFKGILNIVIRDVSEPEGACQDLRKVISTLASQNRTKFINTIFSGMLKIVPLHYFEAEEFEQEVDKLREMYLQREAHWRSGEEFLYSMKAVLAQINSNDMESLDSRIAATRLNEMKVKFEEALKDSEKTADLLGKTHEISKNLEISGSSATVKFTFSDILHKPGDVISSVYELLNQYFPAAKLNHHNEFYSKAKELIQLFFDSAEPILKAKFTDSISHSAEFAEQIEYLYMKDIKPAFEHYYQVNICGRSCKQCKRICPLKVHREEQPCDCGTDHTCRDACPLCGQKCMNLYGHDEEHSCGKTHNCGQGCRYCKGICKFDKLHSGDHTCGQVARHQCESKCLLYEVCKGRCANSKETPHTSHACLMSTCGLPCTSKGCKVRCCHPDHLHSLAGATSHSCPKHADSGSPSKKR